MGYLNDNISVSWLSYELYKAHRDTCWEDCDGEVDVRLQATEHDGWLHVGDACYDTDHSGYWGAGVMTQDMDREALGQLAEDLIEQANEMAAENYVPDCPTKKWSMSDEMRWRLAQARAVRIYEKSDDKSSSFGPVKLNLAGDPWWSYRGVWVFQFGAYGTTHVLAYGELENALEDTAAWLKDHAPGHLTEPDYVGARDELLSEGRTVDSLTDEEIAQLAETGLTYTESGWLTSYEWTVTELHEPSGLLAYVRRD